MPNETLIGQLDTLRDAYTQQQKVVVSLQTAFKAVTNAHRKAQKALRDFSAQNGGISMSGAQEAFAQTRLKEEAIDPILPDLRRELKGLTALTGALRDATAALRSEPV